MVGGSVDTGAGPMRVVVLAWAVPWSQVMDAATLTVQPWAVE